MTGTYSGADKRLQYLFQNAKEVSFTQTLESGTAIGTLTIDGTALVLYAPSGGGGGSTVVVTPIVEDGIEIATITVDGSDVSIYSPDYEAIVEDTIEVIEENAAHMEVTVYNEPTMEIGSIGGTPIYVPAGTEVDYDTEYEQGIVVGTLNVRYLGNNPDYDPTDPSSEKYAVIDKQPFQIIIPSGGGSGNVDDVYVNGSSVVTNHIAQIDLTGYATGSDLQSAVDTLEANFQAGVDAIYEACVRKGSTPASHSLADVVAAIYAIGTDIEYRNVQSTLNVNMRYFGHAEEQ